jgi:PAS domain S-box-containing protein
MPLRPDPFLRRFEVLRRARQHPIVGYLAAVCGVALASGVRWSVDELLEAGPFMSFYPAILLAALLGGWRAASVAVALSALSANYLLYSAKLLHSASVSELVVTTSFLAVSALLILLVVVLNEAIDRLWHQSESTRFVLETETAGVIAVDDRGVINLVNAAIERQLGYHRDELLGRPVEMLIPRDHRSRHGRHRANFMAAPEPRSMGAGRDLYALHKDGSLVPVEVGLNPFVLNGRKGALATVLDISERKNFEKRAQVLSNEVLHRASNMLAIVQAVARRTIAPEHRKRFLAVLEALARTHDPLVTNAPMPLHAIVMGELAGFGAQVNSAVDEVMLTPRAAQDFALIVHELATNALKHGALSTEDGEVLVVGRRGDDQTLVFVWEESGGPAVAEPSRKGFGFTILNDVARGFASAVALEYAPGGFRYELKAELDRIGAEVPVVQAMRTRQTA